MTEADPDEPLLKFDGLAWIPAPDEPRPAPNWLNGRAIAGVWRDTLPLVAGGLASHKQFPQMMPGAGWAPRPEPDSEQDVLQAIAAKLHLGLRSLPILAAAQLVVLEPGAVQGFPDWDDEEEPARYAAEAVLPTSPLFLDFESPSGECIVWEKESWPSPFNLRGALGWVRDGMLSIIPFGSVDGLHPWGGTDYQAWSRWVFLQHEPDVWPAPGPGDCIARANGEVASWVRVEDASICAHQAAVGCHLTNRVLRLLWMLERLEMRLTSPRLPRPERRRAQRRGQSIGLVPTGLPVSIVDRSDDIEGGEELAATCPISSTHARLNQAHALWHSALDAYHDPKGFVAQVNLLIQTLRNVTWVLQKEIGGHADLIPWYEAWQDRMSADPRLRWARQARNQIVKQGDLTAHSKARVQVAGEVIHSTGVDIDVDPATSADEIVRKLNLGALPERARREGTLVVERRWVVEAFPEEELLDVLAHCYGVLARIVDQAHRRLGADVGTCQETAEDECASWRFVSHVSGRLPCMSAGREARTSRRDLSTGAPTRVTVRAVTRPPPDDAVIKERYATVKWERLDAEAGVFDVARVLHQSARGMLLVDGYHVMLAWLLRGHRPVAQHHLWPEDQRAKYLMIQTLAAEATQIGADAIILTAEAWEASVPDHSDPRARLRASERPDRTEALVTHALSRDGRARTWRSAMTRGDDGLSLDDPVTDDDVPPLLRPMLDAWAQWSDPA